MTKNTVKSCIIALVTAISATICGDMVTIYHNHQLNGKPISVWGQIACVSYACATNSADFKLSFVQSLAAKGTSITNAYPLIDSNPSSNASNYFPSATIYVKPGDYFLCSGTDATNGNANCTIFIKR